MMQLNAASEKKLAGVKPDLVRVVRRAAELTAQPFQIVQGNRTQAEQNALYAQGRTKKGPIVTWTKNSKHIGGGAIDYAALVNGKISWVDKYYPAIAHAFKAAAKELGIGIEWGGDWKTKDWGHIQLTGKAAIGVKASAEAKVDLSMTVKEVQEALVSLGYKPGTPDGKLGPKTAAAVKAFQGSNNLKKDGIPGPITSSALKKALQALKAAPVSQSNRPLPAAPEPPVAAEQTKNVPLEAIKTFMELGWPKFASIALVANMVWESGGNQTKPYTIIWGAQGDKDKTGAYHAFGGAQWLGPRFEALQEFAKGMGKPWTDSRTQLLFTDRELNTTERRAATALRAATSLEEAMAAALTFWRPSVPHADRRMVIARNLLDQLG